jgi:hypothetical protein
VHNERCLLIRTVFIILYRMETDAMRELIGFFYHTGDPVSCPGGIKIPTAEKYSWDGSVFFLMSPPQPSSA